MSTKTFVWLFLVGLGMVVGALVALLGALHKTPEVAAIPLVVGGFMAVLALIFVFTDVFEGNAGRDTR